MSHRRATGYALLAAVLLFALVAGIWGLKVATAGIRGAGDAHTQKESASNRLAAQERFEDLYAEVIAADQRVTVAHDALLADPRSQVARTNFTGAVSYCLDVVADYNAEARKYRTAEFRAADLPEQIDPYSPDTDCNEENPVR